MHHPTRTTEDWLQEIEAGLGYGDRPSFEMIYELIEAVRTLNRQLSIIESIAKGDGADMQIEYGLGAWRIETQGVYEPAFGETLEEALMDLRMQQVGDS